jgi:hypothetical protein
VPIFAHDAVDIARANLTHMVGKPICTSQSL